MRNPVHVQKKKKNHPEINERISIVFPLNSLPSPLQKKKKNNFTRQLTSDAWPSVQIHPVYNNTTICRRQKNKFEIVLRVHTISLWFAAR